MDAQRLVLTNACRFENTEPIVRTEFTHVLIANKGQVYTAEESLARFLKSQDGANDPR